MSSDSWVQGNLQARIGYGPDFLRMLNEFIETVIHMAVQDFRPLQFEGEYPLTGIGIALLSPLDYKDGKAPEQAFLAILDIESETGDFMIQFTANGIELPWTRVGRKTGLMRPIGVRPGQTLTFKTNPPNTSVELWGFVIGTANYLRSRNLKEIPLVPD